MTYKDELIKISNTGTAPAPYQRTFSPEAMSELIQKQPCENVGTYAGILGCSRSTALNLINQLIKEGLVEKKIKEVGASKKVFASYVRVVAEKKG